MEKFIWAYGSGGMESDRHGSRRKKLRDQYIQPEAQSREQVGSEMRLHPSKAHL